MQSSKRREQEKFFEKIRQEDQWRSQTQGGHGGMGTSPSGVQGRGPGGGLWASIFLRSGCPWKTGSPGLTGEAAASLWIRHCKHLRLSLRNMLIIILLLFNSYCLCNLAFWLQYLNKLTYLLTNY